MNTLTPEERGRILADLLVEEWRMSVLSARTSNRVKEERMRELEAKVAWYSYRSEEY